MVISAVPIVLVLVALYIVNKLTAVKRDVD